MLRPTIFTDEELNNIELEESSESSSKTYSINFETGEIETGFIDRADSIRQFIVKSLKTIRDKYLIYSSEVGSEISYLTNELYSLDYLELEVPRLVEETLLVDDRILNVDNFVITKDFDVLNISFNVQTNVEEEIISMEVRI